MQKSALIVGASGVIGTALSERLLGQGWVVHALSRGRTAVVPGTHPIATDLTSEADVSSALRGLRVDAVFLAAWARQASEAENIRVNAAIVRHVLAATGEGLRGGHAALVTGLKHYLGPFEAYATGQVPETPFREEQGRQPVDNFYYAQEDELFAAAGRHGFSWSVHRPHTVIGFAIGNAMNMGVTLAAYATLCKESGEPFVFPGSAAQWNGVTDMTDAGLLARHLEWAATTESAHDADFNVVNGDVFRWRWMWQEIAGWFGIEAAPFDGTLRPLAARMADAGERWRQVAQRHGLAQPELAHLASWWHTDADLGRPLEVIADMGKSRRLGFLDYENSRDAFFRLFDRLKAARIIPA